MCFEFANGRVHADLDKPSKQTVFFRLVVSWVTNSDHE